MKLKPRYKRRMFWIFMSAMILLAFAFVLVPTYINLNKLKPKIEQSIYEQIGVIAKINGDINFSLLGTTTIVAHDISLSYGDVKSLMFKIPLSKIFNLGSADFKGTIYVNGARLHVSELKPMFSKQRINIKNSQIVFSNQTYDIISGVLSNGLLRGTVRSKDHKYDFDYNGDVFHISNKPNNFTVTGQLFSDGTASGQLSIDTNDLNDWFGFSEPKIYERIKLDLDFKWDGKYGFEFSNIQGDDFTGDIKLYEDGSRHVSLYSHGANIDLSFLLNQTGIFYKTGLDLEFWGNIKLGDKTFNHVKIDVTGYKDSVQINKIIADDINISGGFIKTTGAENLPINLILNNKKTFCLFSGDPVEWECSKFSQDDLTGSVIVKENYFDINIVSQNNMPKNINYKDSLKTFGTHGKLSFQFQDIGGVIYIDKKEHNPRYDFAKNKNLDWLGLDIYFLPESMRKEPGDFIWKKSELFFQPFSNEWSLSFSGDYFYISGTSIKSWFPDINLDSLIDVEYIISGNMVKDNISNLQIKTAGHVFQGSAVKNNIVLHTDLLVLDSFINQDYLDRYEEMQFLGPEPLLMPFLLNTNISLSVDTLIHNGDEFSNFIYSLKPGVQKFSITDSLRGNLLASVTKNTNKYNFVFQLNKFITGSNLLSYIAPLNISNTMITAEANLTTSGQIAYDVWNNLEGSIDLSFDGGIISGLGFDSFYSNTNNITTLNAEYILSDALERGQTDIKSMHITGDYKGGNFATTRPFVLSMRHVDATGLILINGGKMAAKIDFILRGTSPKPAPISMEIFPDGQRKYSLSDIMINFDSDFLKNFSETHLKF